jgi:hypothetical protein
MSKSKNITLPATSDCAFWGSLMISWIAQDAEGLLDVAKPVLWLIGAGAIFLVGGAVVTAWRQPWQAGSMKLAPAFAKIYFVTMIAVTCAWITFGIAFTRTSAAQILYGTCTLLSGWSAWAIFATLNAHEAQSENQET